LDARKFLFLCQFLWTECANNLQLPCGLKVWCVFSGIWVANCYQLLRIIRWLLLSTAPFFLLYMIWCWLVQFRANWERGSHQGCCSSYSHLCYVMIWSNKNFVWWHRHDDCTFLVVTTG
jgi:hypothetical protein